MKIKNIFNLGILVVLGFGSLSAHTSKSYPLPELSHPLDLSSCTNSTYLAQQYELVNLKASISGEVQYFNDRSLIPANNGELLNNCFNKSEASEKELPSVQFAGLRLPTRSVPSVGRVRSLFREQYQHKPHIPFREVNKYRTSPSLERILSGSDKSSEIPALSNQERASLGARSRIDQ